MLQFVHNHNLIVEDERRLLAFSSNRTIQLVQIEHCSLCRLCVCNFVLGKISERHGLNYGLKLGLLVCNYVFELWSENCLNYVFTGSKHARFY